MKKINVQILNMALATTLALGGLSLPMEAKAESGVVSNIDNQQVDVSISAINYGKYDIYIVKKFIHGNEEKCIFEIYGLTEEPIITEMLPYIAKEGDNLSRVSEHVSRKYGLKPTPLYWPELAFTNGYPRVMQPGDTIYYPATQEAMELIYVRLDAIKWISYYKRTHNIYGKKLSINQIVDIIYGEGACQDKEFVRKFITWYNLKDPNNKQGNMLISDKYLADVIFESVGTKEEIDNVCIDPDSQYFMR